MRLRGGAEVAEGPSVRNEPGVNARCNLSVEFDAESINQFQCHHGRCRRRNVDHGNRCERGVRRMVIDRSKMRCGVSGRLQRPQTIDGADIEGHNHRTTLCLRRFDQQMLARKSAKHPRDFKRIVTEGNTNVNSKPIKSDADSQCRSNCICIRCHMSQQQHRLTTGQHVNDSLPISVRGCSCPRHVYSTPT